MTALNGFICVVVWGLGVGGGALTEGGLAATASSPELNVVDSSSENVLTGSPTVDASLALTLLYGSNYCRCCCYYCCRYCYYFGQYRESADKYLVLPMLLRLLRLLILLLLYAATATAMYCYCYCYYCDCYNCRRYFFLLQYRSPFVLQPVRTPPPPPAEHDTDTRTAPLAVCT